MRSVPDADAGLPHLAPERFAPGRADLDRDNGDWEIMLRSLMAIWAAGATFFLLIVLFSEPPAGSRAQLLRIDIVGFALLGMLIAGRDRLPWWTPDVCAYVLYVAVGGIILTYQDVDSPYGFFYLWLSVHSFYFLPWKRAAPQVVFIAVNYAATLLAIPGPDFPIMRWSVTVLTTVLTCAMVAMLRARVDGLVDRLAGMARADALTGLRNRRAYDEHVAQEIARSDRTGRPLTLVLGDLDHFKGVNDRYGHPTGDAVLRRVAMELEGVVRVVDVVARLGGEEFALLLPDTGAEGAYLVAERARHAFAAAFRGHPVRATMSFGIACYPDDGKDADSLFQAADTALLAAKRGGRDRVVVYGAGLPAVPPGVRGPGATSPSPDGVAGSRPAMQTFAVAEYEAVFRAADREADRGQYKEAYNTLGQALEHEGPHDRECRHRRGTYALQIGQMRLDHLREAADQTQTLVKAACWLARSEAYLTSAAEGATEEERRAIADDLDRTREQQERFRSLCREVGLDLFR